MVSFFVVIKISDMTEVFANNTVDSGDWDFQVFSSLFLTKLLFLLFLSSFLKDFAVI